jgi:sugar lactone lactonase YvrE
MPRATPPVPHAPSPTAGGRPRFRRGLLLVLVIAAAAGGLLWWRARLARVPPLESGWPAVVRVLAGTGVPGWRDGSASRARFTDPFGIAVADEGTVYVSDAGSTPRIRAIRPDGEVYTLAGGVRGLADGRAGDARFDTPSGLAVAPGGVVYVADTANNAIRRVAPDGSVTTIAGGGLAGYRDGAADQALFNGPIGVAVDRSGRVIVADTYNDRIRALSPDGTVVTLAGTGLPGYADGPGSDALVHTPCGVAVDAGGVVYVADTGNGLIRTIDPGGSVGTVPVALPDGLVRPIGVAIAGGSLFVTDDRGRVVEIGRDGRGRVLAGSTPGFQDGAGPAARLRRPAGLAVVAPGRLVVADAGNALVRVVAAPARLGTALPASPLIDPQFDAAAFGRIPLLWPIAPMEGPFEIAGTLGEARGAEGSERFHAGVDIRIGEGSEVHAVRPGTVSSPISNGEFGTLNEWLRIGPVAYVHIRAGRRGGANASLLAGSSSQFVPTYDATGRMVEIRVKRGARFETGEVIATVNAFNHVHLNVGWPGEEYNPLRFRLPHFTDSIPPTIRRNGIHLFDAGGRPLVERQRGRVRVSGRVSIVVDAWDQADGNRPNRRLGLYSIGYQVLTPDLTPAPGFEAPVETLRFDRLGVSADAARLVYGPGSGIPYYGRRVTRFLYVATNTFDAGVAAEAFWDTTALPPGDYVLRIWARDIRGNVAVANRDLRVTVAGDDIPDAPHQP